PRIAIFDTDETTTTRRGIYVAYMFAADMSTVTLTLNQGTSEISELLGRPAARRSLAWNAAEIRACLKHGDIADLDTTIDLLSNAPLSVDYQHANILARSYKLKSLPSERAMQADLQRFTALYALVLSARGSRRQQGAQPSVTPADAPPVTKTVAKTVTNAVTSAAKRAATKAATKAVTESVAKAATKAVTESVAEVAPTSDDARLPEPAGRAGRTSVMTRRGLFVALAAMPVAIVT